MTRVQTGRGIGLPLDFPFGGLVENTGFDRQPPGTTPECQNVRGFDPQLDRLRGAQRAGTIRHIEDRIVRLPTGNVTENQTLLNDDFAGAADTKLNDVGVIYQEWFESTAAASSDIFNPFDADEATPANSAFELDGSGRARIDWADPGGDEVQSRVLEKTGSAFEFGNGTTLVMKVKITTFTGEDTSGSNNTEYHAGVIFRGTANPDSALNDVPECYVVAWERMNDLDEHRIVLQHIVRASSVDTVTDLQTSASLGPTDTGEHDLVVQIIDRRVIVFWDGVKRIDYTLLAADGGLGDTNVKVGLFAQRQRTAGTFAASDTPLFDDFQIIAATDVFLGAPFQDLNQVSSVLDPRTVVPGDTLFADEFVGKAGDLIATGDPWVEHGDSVERLIPGSLVFGEDFSGSAGYVVTINAADWEERGREETIAAGFHASPVQENADAVGRFLRTGSDIKLDLANDVAGNGVPTDNQNLARSLIVEDHTRSGSARYAIDMEIRTVDNFPTANNAELIQGILIRGDSTGTPFQCLVIGWVRIQGTDSSHITIRRYDDTGAVTDLQTSVNFTPDAAYHHLEVRVDQNLVEVRWDRQILMTRNISSDLVGGAGNILVGLAVARFRDGGVWANTENMGHQRRFRLRQVVREPDPSMYGNLSLNDVWKYSASDEAQVEIDGLDIVDEVVAFNFDAGTPGDSVNETNDVGRGDDVALGSFPATITDVQDDQVEYSANGVGGTVGLIFDWTEAADNMSQARAWIVTTTGGPPGNPGEPRRQYIHPSVISVDVITRSDMETADSARIMKGILLFTTPTPVDWWAAVWERKAGEQTQRIRLIDETDADLISPVELDPVAPDNNVHTLQVKWTPILVGSTVLMQVFWDGELLMSESITNPTLVNSNHGLLEIRTRTAGTWNQELTNAYDNFVISEGTELVGMNRGGSLANQQIKKDVFDSYVVKSRIRTFKDGAQTNNATYFLGVFIRGLTAPGGGAPTKEYFAIGWLRAAGANTNTIVLFKYEEFGGGHLVLAETASLGTSDDEFHDLEILVNRDFLQVQWDGNLQTWQTGSGNGFIAGASGYDLAGDGFREEDEHNVLGVAFWRKRDVGTDWLIDDALNSARWDRVEILSAERAPVPRVVELTGIANGTFKRVRQGETQWTDPTSGSGIQFDPAVQTIQTTRAFSRLYGVDGFTYKVYDPATGALDDWDASEGTVPGGDGSDGPADGSVRCRLIALYRGRMVLSGKADEPQNWFMSRIADPDDWDFPSVLLGADDPVAGNLSVLGELSDIVTALIPYHEETMIFGGARSVWVMTGDPLASVAGAPSRFNSLSRDIGIAGPRAWAQGPNKIIYFFGTGGLYAIFPNTFNITQNNRISAGKLDRTFAQVDFSKNLISLEWDPLRFGLWIFIEATDGSERRHWFWDERTKAFWPDVLPTDFGPTVSHVFSREESSGTREILIGGRDGIVRKYDNDATDDDKKAIDSFCVFPPILSASSVHKTTITRLDAILAEGSNSLDYKMRSHRSVERLLSAQARYGGRWIGGGAQRSDTHRALGSVFSLRVQNNRKGERWALESIHVGHSGAGLVRDRKGK